MSGVVEGRGVGRHYGRKRVLDDLSFEIDPGVTVLLGPNGAGKTTLLDTIVTLHRPSAGSLRVLGLDVTTAAGRRELRRRIGFLPQTFGYFANFTAAEFVQYVGWLKRVPANRLVGAAATALAAVDLVDRAGDKLGTLSGGMLRRVGIAQAIVQEPALVVLDEPAVGLDPIQRIEFRALVRELGRRSTVIVSTHIVDDVRSMADTVMVLSDGTFVFTGSPAELERRALADVAGDSNLERGYSTVLGSTGAER
jgi:ABC-2 type transport system ATP-binding protein